MEYGLIKLDLASPTVASASKHPTWVRNIHYDLQKTIRLHKDKLSVRF